mmetsp:Transcript_12908/g.28513  ORF Transcript_12908/g.28513 Transcript_12908/m.28513 type:complete len:302 (-) Transcript_12908:669-1574(-)
MAALNKTIRNNAYYDQDANTIFSCDDTVFTSNDRDNRTGMGKKSSLQYHMSTNNTSAQAVQEAAEGNLDERSPNPHSMAPYQDDDQSKSSFLTWQPAAPGLRKMMNYAKSSARNRISDIETQATQATQGGSWVSGTLGESYIGGKMTCSKLDPAETMTINTSLHTSGIPSMDRDMTGPSMKTNDDTVGTNCDTIGSHTFTTLGEDEVYIVKQRYGYLAITFSIFHVFIMAGMIAMCGLAPPDVNPMIGPYPDAMSTWGAKNAYAVVLGGDWWRTLSSSMLHVGFFPPISQFDYSTRNCFLF